MSRALICGCLLVASSSQLAAAPVLSATSYGKIVFGDRLETVESRLKEKAPPPVDFDEAGCRQLEFAAYPGLLFMVQDGIVTRAETANPVPTSLGLTVGASFNAARQRIPSAVVSPHMYDPNGHCLTVTTMNARAALVMEEAGGRITAVRGGLVPSVSYVEGCL